MTENFQELIEKVLQKGKMILPDLGYEEEVFVEVTNDKKIQEVNKETRNIDKSTDVLSFPMLELCEGKGTISNEDIDPETGKIFLGDILISLDHAKVQAEEYGHSLEREIAFLTCHGYLHLKGFDHIDKCDEEKMIKKQKEILEGVAER